MPATKYGDCSAYLFMSREYGVDYGDLCVYADYILRGTLTDKVRQARERLLKDAGERWDGTMGDGLKYDVIKQVHRFQHLQAGAESAHQSEPQGVQWWTHISVSRYIPEHS